MSDGFWRGYVEGSEAVQDSNAHMEPRLRLNCNCIAGMVCTSWYITITHLPGGDTGRAIAWHGFAYKSKVMKTLLGSGL